MKNNPIKSEIVDFVKKRHGGSTAVEVSVFLDVGRWKVQRYFKQLESEGVFEKVTYGRYKVKRS